MQHKVSKKTSQRGSRLAAGYLPRHGTVPMNRARLYLFSFLSVFVVQPSLPVPQLAVMPHWRQGPYMGQAGRNSCHCTLTPPPVCFAGTVYAKKAKLGFLASEAEKCLIPGVLAWVQGKSPIIYSIWQARNLCPHSEPCVCVQDGKQYLGGERRPQFDTDLQVNDIWSCV